MRVVVFSGKNCTKCVSLKSMLENLEIDFEEKDVMSNLSESRALAIKSIPTTIIYNNDVIIGKVLSNNIDEIKTILEGISK